MGSKMKKYLAILLIVPFLFTGCATILQSADDTVSLESQPQKASVYINGNLSGETPLIIKLPRNKNQIVEFRLDGYHSKMVPIERQTQAGYVVFDVLFGLLPVIVDAANGAWFELEPISVYLEKENK
jgi:hypothetical protein